MTLFEIIFFFFKNCTLKTEKKAYKFDEKHTKHTIFAEESEIGTEQRAKITIESKTMCTAQRNGQD